MSLLMQLTHFYPFLFALPFYYSFLIPYSVITNFDVLSRFSSALMKNSIPVLASSSEAIIPLTTNLMPFSGFEISVTLSSRFKISVSISLNLSILSVLFTFSHHFCFTFRLVCGTCSAHQPFRSKTY